MTASPKRHSVVVVASEGAAKPRWRYVIETLLQNIGYPCRWLSSPSDHQGSEPCIAVLGKDESTPSNADIVIEVGSLGDFRADNLDVRWLDDVPILFPKNRPAPECVWAEKGPGFDLLGAAFFALARLEEHHDPQRDLWETYAGAFSALHELGILTIPWVDIYTALLAEQLDKVIQERATGLEPLPRWPDGKQFAVSLSHDCDYISHGPAKPSPIHRARSLKALARTAREHYRFRRRVKLGQDPFCTFDKWAGLEERFGAKSSFYWAADIQNRHHYDPEYAYHDWVNYEGRPMALREMLRLMHERGFEMGVHGSYMSHQDADRLRSERERLSAVIGDDAVGIRQHYLRFSAAHTWQCQRRAGFLYDSTLGYNECEGFRAGTSMPFRPYDLAEDAVIPIWEIGLHLYEKIFPGDGFYKLDMAKCMRRARRLIDRVEEVGGCLSLLWHPNCWDDTLFPLQRRLYEAILEELAERKAWMTSGLEIARWCEQRRQQLQSSDD